MFRNQLTALFTHDRIITTLAKAKELRPLAERMVTLARTGSLPARRKVLTMVPDKEVVQRLFDDIAPRFMDRPGGYTRVMRLGRRRGDGAELAIIEFVDYELADHEEGGASSKGKSSLMDRAKGMFGGGAKAGEAETEAADEQEMAVEEPEVEASAEPEVIEAAPVEEEPEAVEAAPAEEEPETAETVSPEEPEVVEAKADDDPEAVETAPASEDSVTAAEQPEASSEEPEAAEAETTEEVADDEEKKDS
jgi:large subunit ribosomal protein L17